MTEIVGVYGCTEGWVFVLESGGSLGVGGVSDASHLPGSELARLHVSRCAQSRAVGAETGRRRFDHPNDLLDEHLNTRFIARWR